MLEEFENSFTTQSAQAVSLAAAPAAASAWPAAHVWWLRQKVCPSWVWYLPPGHEPHASAELRPVAPPNRPAAHPSHDVWPAAAW
jgi:hypothetical protein